MTHKTCQRKGKTHTANADVRLPFSLDCRCGWFWEGNKQSSVKLMKRLHSKKCNNPQFGNYVIHAPVAAELNDEFIVLPLRK